MKKYLTILLVCCPLFATHGKSSFGNCGEYNVRGMGRIINNIPLVIVNEHSRSEYILNVPIEEEPKIAPYIDRSFEFSGQIEKGFNGTRAIIKNIKNISRRIANPLSKTPDTGLTLINKMPCKN